MSNFRVTIRDDSENECPIENIRTFRKHLQLFHKKRSLHTRRERTLFHCGRLLQSKIDAMVSKLSG